MEILLAFLILSVVEKTALNDPRMVVTTMDRIKKASNISISVKPDFGYGMQNAGCRILIAGIGRWEALIGIA